MNKFYVYALIDPRNNQIFYIGKGKGLRHESHLKETHSSSKNSAKFLKIRNILDLDLEIKIEKIFENLEESQAFLLEKILIEKLGRLVLKTGYLTNLVPGGNWSKDNSIFVEKEFDLEFEIDKLEDIFKSSVRNIGHLQSIIENDYLITYESKEQKKEKPKSLSLEDLIDRKNKYLKHNT